MTSATIADASDHERLASSGNQACWKRILWILAAWIVLLTRVEWPSRLPFFSNSTSSIDRLVNAPVLLPEDVMITMRTGQILNEVGIPSFNVGDVSQPSTSYAGPYLAAALLKALPDNVALMWYAAGGLCLTMLALAMLIAYSRVLLNGALLAIALALTTTAQTYVFGGWDSVYSTALVTIGLAMLLRPLIQEQAQSWFAVLGLGALSVAIVFRPDALIIALAGVVVTLSASSVPARIRILALAVFVTPLAITAAVNVQQFGGLLPTTYRLKFGQQASPEVLLRSVGEVSWGEYSAATLTLILLAYCVVLLRGVFRVPIVVVTIAILATDLFAVVNADYLPAGRFYWLGASALAVVVSATATQPFLRVGLRDRSSASEVVTAADEGAAPRPKGPWQVALVGVIIAAMVIGIAYGAALRLRKSIGQSAIYPTPTASVAPERTRIAQIQVTASWIRDHLDPGDGSVMLFQAGNAFSLPTFEIADPLGRADESIAQLPPGEGPSGHNKYDYALSLKKWNPQAIVPVLPWNPNDLNLMKSLSTEGQVSSPSAFHFVPDFFIDSTVRSRYMFCKLSDEDLEAESWNVLWLRNDMVKSLGLDARCSPMLPLGSQSES